MHIQKALTICIYGPSGVGKTTIAITLAQVMQIPVRHCGDAVRKKAESLGVGINALDHKAHFAINQETLQWSKENSVCVVEGRFLDAVFKGWPLPCLLVQLAAAEHARVERLSRRNCKAFDLSSLSEVDAVDASVRVGMSSSSGSRAADLVVDTTFHTVDECVEWIQSAVANGRTEPA